MTPVRSVWWRSRTAARRRGAALLFIVVTLVVVSLMMVTLTQGVVRQHRQMLQERTRWQAELCADAGLDRLARLLGESPETTTDTWTFTPDEARPDQTAVVTSQIESLTTSRQVTVVAEYPAGSTHRIRIRRVVEWPLAATLTTENLTLPVSALNLENLP